MFTGIVEERGAVREIESELAAVRQHLDFAARLVGSAETGDDPRKELAPRRPTRVRVRFVPDPPAA